MRHEQATPAPSSPSADALVRQARLRKGPWRWRPAERGRDRHRHSSSSPSPDREAWSLIGYLDQLEGWSLRVWAAAGIRRPWLPDVVRRQFGDQWWTGSQLPATSALRGSIASFWTRVTPWLAWDPGVEDLPDPPPDPELLDGMVASLNKEIDRGGRPLVGSERSAALQRAVRRLELLRSLHRAGRVRRPS